MTFGEIKEKGIKGVKTIIYGRTLFVLLGFILQFALMIATFQYLREYSMIVYAVFVVVGLLVVLHLYNGRGTPEFKLVWMLPVLVFPVFGSIFYL